MMRIKTKNGLTYLFNLNKITNTEEVLSIECKHRYIKGSIAILEGVKE